MFKTYIYITSFVFSVLFTACNDWNEVEPVKINTPKVQNENPEAYAKYLENVRNYKNTPHKITYVAFDNGVKNPFSKSQHINVIPDSVDFVVLNSPNNLPDWQIREMEDVKKNKGTKFILRIDYEEIKITYDNKKNEIETEGDEEAIKKFPVWETFVVDSLQKALHVVDKYNYDGFSFKYNGKFVDLLSFLEKSDVKRQQGVLLNIVKFWKTKNPKKTLFFEGLPQNLIDKSILKNCQYIVILANNVFGPNDIDLKISQAMVENVPVDKFIISVDNVSNDPQKSSQGYWGTTDKYRATTGAAKYIMQDHRNFKVNGLGTSSINCDYYSEGQAYKYVREAIKIMNPPLKN